MNIIIQKIFKLKSNKSWKTRTPTSWWDLAECYVPRISIAMIRMPFCEHTTLRYTPHYWRWLERPENGKSDDANLQKVGFSCNTYLHCTVHKLWLYRWRAIQIMEYEAYLPAWSMVTAIVGTTETAQITPILCKTHRQRYLHFSHSFIGKKASVFQI